MGVAGSARRRGRQPRRGAPRRSPLGVPSRPLRAGQLREAFVAEPGKALVSLSQYNPALAVDGTVPENEITSPFTALLEELAFKDKRREMSLRYTDDPTFRMQFHQEVQRYLDNINLDDVNKWKTKAEEYKRLEKNALLQLDSLELEKGIKTDDESLFTEHDESDMKKEKKIEDIFDDPGFLEF